MATTRKVATAIRAALNPDGLHIAQFNGSAAGQTVFHLHVHIVPRWAGQAPGFVAHGQGQFADADALQALAQEIRAHL